uniref:Uncharacterized protein n=1 Tax=Anguilla anguilla TaxID=7936 RepID=A0A0E9WMQ6_ANGAN
MQSQKDIIYQFPKVTSCSACFRTGSWAAAVLSQYPLYRSMERNNNF